MTRDDRFETVSYNGQPTKVTLRGSAFVVAMQQSRRTTLFLRKI